MADNQLLTIGRLPISTKTYFAVLFKLFVWALIVIRGLLLTTRTADCRLIQETYLLQCTLTPTFTKLN